MTVYLRIGPDFKHCHTKTQVGMTGPCDPWAFDHVTDGPRENREVRAGDSVWVKVKGLTDWMLAGGPEFLAFRASLEASQ